MTNSETPDSQPFEGTTKQSKAPTKADLMEIRSLYAQADAMAEAAETLGADRLRTVWHVILPLSFPGVVAGCTLVFTLNMTAFATPVLLGGNGTRVMTVLIYQQFSQVFNWPFGAASAVVLLGLTFLVLFVFLRMVMRRAAAWMEARPEGNAS